MARKSLFLLDGSSLVYRSYYALLRGGRGGDRPTSLTTSGGLPTGAVYGFLTTLRKILADGKPDYVGIAFDHKVPTFRHEAYKEYKANRKPMPDDLALQLPYVKRAVEALRIPVLIEPRYEADDILGTLSKKAAAAGLAVTLVTMDKDMYQLLGPEVSMLQLRSETKLIRAEDVAAEFGVPPERVADVLALWGDPSDNIPGVPGIGEKGAKALVNEWGGIDDIYRALDKLKPALAAKLKAAEAEARLSRELATIATDLELPLDLDALRRDAPDEGALYELCKELEFKNLLAEFAPPEPVLAADTASYPVWTDLESIAGIAAAARRSGMLALDLVLARPDPTRATLLGLGVSSAAGASAYLPLAHAYLGAPPQPALGAALDRLRPALEDPAVAKIGGDLKAATIVLARHGVRLGGHQGDVRVLSYLLDPGRPSHEIEALARDVLRRRVATFEEVAGKGKERLDLAAVPVERMAGVAAARAAAALDLAPALATEIEARGLGPLYRDIELPLIAVLAAMELHGVAIDLAFLAEMSRDLEARLDDLTRRIHALAGVEFNIQSPRQLGEVLFDKMQLPTRKKTRISKAASTDIEVLEELAESFELPRLVLEHREIAKLKGTYVDALPQLVHAESGRVHTCYNQTVAATGRLSSSDPNLQNIPIRTELGRRIRRAFVAAPGYTLLVADYSQIELRLVAHLSADPELIAAFHDGADVHTRTAATMFGVAEGLVNTELRRRAKTINFGIIYGMSGFGLSRELKIKPAEGARLIAQYFERYAGVRAWLDRTIAEARASGQVKTLLGRVRYLPEINSPTRSVREYAERTATNTPIQGTAADLIKLAMVRIARRLEREGLGTRLLLQVHDELVLEVPAGERDPALRAVREEMEQVLPLSVPLVVTAAFGPNWLEAK